MKCADPILCYRTSTGATYRHFSLATSLFKRLANFVYDCGKCIFCRKKKARELAVRCVLHASLYTQNCFITLTYDEKQKDYHNDLQYSDIQKFKKKLRRYCDYHHSKKIQIFNVHEYGKNGKKHWHLVVFNHDFIDSKPLPGSDTLYTSETLLTQWTHGHHTIGSVTEASAMYQAQYTQKDVKNGNLNNKKKAHSKHAGIGRDYFLKHYKQILSLGYIPFAEQKIPIPRYFIKIAHKHYSFFHEKGNFQDYSYRKKLYSLTPSFFPQMEISELYILNKTRNDELIERRTIEWEIELKEILEHNKKPEFKLAAENYLYDLKNKINNDQNF